MIFLMILWLILAIWWIVEAIMLHSKKYRGSMRRLWIAVILMNVVNIVIQIVRIC